DAHAVHLDWRRNQIAIRADQEEWIRRRRACSSDIASEEELVEARRARIKQTEAVTTGRYLQERLDHAVHQELIAQNSIQIEQVEYQLTGLGIENLVGESQRNIELWEAGKTEAGGFIARIQIVEKAIEPEQSFVGVLRGEV